MRSKIAVDVLDDEILVTMPGTSFSIIYERTKDNQLIASHFSGRKVQDERGKMSFPHFLSLAWTAANEKAREIGWIVADGVTDVLTAGVGAILSISPSSPSSGS